MGIFTTDKTRLLKDGKDFKFLGCNMYGLGKVADWQAEQMLKDAKEEGFEAVRFWAFEPTDKKHFEFICNLSSKLNLYLLPCLADKWGYLQHYKISNEWYLKGYKEHYLNYAKDMVSSFKDRDEIILWEILNEPVTETFEAIYSFTKHVTDELRQINNNHLYSLGTVGGIGDKFGNLFSIFNIENFRNLYSLDGLDLISIHDYSHDSTIMERIEIYYTLIDRQKRAGLFRKLDKFMNIIPDAADRAWLNRTDKSFDLPFGVRNLWRKYNKKNADFAKEIGKPIYAGEIGFKKKHKEFRKELIRKDYKMKMNSGFCGYMLWSYESMGASNDGHGYGISVGEIKELINELKTLRDT